MIFIHLTPALAQKSGTKKETVTIIRESIDEKGNRQSQKIVREVGPGEDGSKIVDNELKRIDKENTKTIKSKAGKEVVVTKEVKPGDPENEVTTILIDKDGMVTINGAEVTENQNIELGDKKIKIITKDDKGSIDLGEINFEDLFREFGEKGKHFMHKIPGFEGYGDSKGFLGVRTEPKGAEGVRITEVTKNSPAEKYGLIVGDIITAVEDQKVETFDDLAMIIGGMKPGDEVMISYIRNNERKQSKIKLDEAPGSDKKQYNFNFDNNGNNFDLAIPPTPPNPPRPMMPDGFSDNYRFDFGGDSRGVKMGVVVEDYESRKIEGAKILEIVPNSMAEHSGLQPGDIIVKMNKEEIENAKDLKGYIKELKQGDEVKIKVKRDGKNKTLKMKVENTQNDRSRRSYKF